MNTKLKILNQKKSSDKMFFSNQNKDTQKFIIITFSMTLIIGILIAHQFYHGTALGIKHLILLQMLIPAFSVILVTKTNKNLEYPKHLFNYYLVIVSFLFCLNLLNTLNIIDMNLITPQLSTFFLLSNSLIFLFFLKYEKKELTIKWKLRGENLSKIIGWTFAYILVYNIFFLFNGFLNGKAIETIRLVFNFKNLLSLILSTLEFPISFIFFFGEEYGWRFFLPPRLRQRFGKIKGVLLLGMIWGIWHFAIVLFYYSEQINFLYAFLSQLINCIYLGVIFAYFYEKTSDIWCISLIHFINNYYTTIYYKGEIHQAYKGDFKTLFISTTVMFIISIPFLFSNVFKEKTNENSSYRC